MTTASLNLSVLIEPLQSIHLGAFTLIFGWRREEDDDFLSFPVKSSGSVSGVDGGTGATEAGGLVLFNLSLRGLSSPSLASKSAISSVDNFRWNVHHFTSGCGGK